MKFTRILILLLMCQFFWCSYSAEVSVQYLTRVEHRKDYTDHIFCCNIEGSGIQWGLNSKSIGGYDLKDKIGITTFNSRHKIFNYTSTLLSKKHITDDRANLESLLIIAVYTNQSISLNVSCNNNKIIRFASNVGNPTFPDKSNHSDNFTTNKNISLVQVLKAEVVQRDEAMTHIFLCRTNSLLQLVGVDKHGVGFDSSNLVGDHKTIKHQADLVYLQAILSARESFQTTTFTIVVTNQSYFSFSCSYKTNIEVSYHNDSQELATSSRQPSTKVPSFTRSAIIMEYTTTVKLQPSFVPTTSPFLSSFCKCSILQQILYYDQLD